MFFLFAALIGSIFVLLLIWVGATVYRLYYPDRPLPFEDDPVVQRNRAAAEGKAVPVGLREIREDRRRERRQKRGKAYCYTWGGSEGFPDDWWDDLRRRRN